MLCLLIFILKLPQLKCLSENCRQFNKYLYFCRLTEMQAVYVRIH
jgi:hypothetical protein